MNLMIIHCVRPGIGEVSLNAVCFNKIFGFSIVCIYKIACRTFDGKN